MKCYIILRWAGGLSFDHHGMSSWGTRENIAQHDPSRNAISQWSVRHWTWKSSGGYKDPVPSGVRGKNAELEGRNRFIRHVAICCKIALVGCGEWVV